MPKAVLAAVLLLALAACGGNPPILQEVVPASQAPAQ